MRTCIIGNLLVFHVLFNIGYGAILSQTTLSIDFTDPNDAKTKAIWSEPEQINITSNGLGWDGRGNSSRDFWIKTFELAIGLSWRPTYSANIVAELEPYAKPVKLDNGKTYKPSPGSMFVRYSSEGKHWSSWQAMQYKATEDKQQSKYQFTSFVRIPEKNRQEYLGYLRKYMKLDVPWQSDEEATVKWILERNPNFFVKSIPFIGYLQLLYETSLYGGQRITRFHTTVNWGVGGKHSPPKDKSVYMNRDIPWRFHASRTPTSVPDSTDAVGAIGLKVADYAWGQERNGLRIGISQVKPSDQNDNDKPRFYVALENVGKKDLVLNLGIMLANGKYQYPELKLVFEDSNGGTYQYESKFSGRVAGRMDPLIVPLAVGCRYVVRMVCDSQKFFPAGTSLPPGRYKVVTVFNGKSLKFKETNLYTRDLYWTGLVKSEEVSFNKVYAHSLF